ncbi:MAG: hypothetical protein KAH56_09985 [Candidatus Krumholzibacteria bacterium]|nr:hypothetical protein [Candidatus Krumholzibacteria bacterium]
MRKYMMITALVFTLVMPGLASAVYLDSVAGTADCNGWNADVQVTFRSGARMVRLDYSVALWDEGGMEMERFDYSESVDIPDQVTVVYSFNDLWTTDLPDGTYSMTADFVLFDIFPDGSNRFEDGFTADFTCGETTGGGGDDPVVTGFCPHGSGFWKNHPADWPVMDLDLGANNLDQAALLDILNTPPRGDATVILARALIAAKLNMAGGAGDGIADVIDAADAYLTEHPVFSDPGKADRKAALAFMNDLGEYNSADCADDEESDLDTSDTEALNFSSSGNDKAAAIETLSMGSLKALYR